MNPKLIRYAERIVAILLSATLLFVFFVRVTHAGGLWRDECDSLELARLPTFADVLHNLKFTSFPILFPTTIRIFTNLFGASDASLRKKDCLQLWSRAAGRIDAQLIFASGAL